LFPGHTLLAPKEHFQTITDLPEKLASLLFLNARKLAGAVEQAMEAEGSFVAINNRVSQSVPHLHIHVVPRNKRDGLKGFFWPRNPYKSEADAQAAASRIRAALTARG
jgi:histidine triad (HIT) family protein